VLLTVFSALLLFNWRNKIIELLTTPIDPGNDPTTAAEETDVVDPEKEQYAEALKAQGEGL
jgi:E3 ubiquitin-protein ligase SHPRH